MTDLVTAAALRRAKSALDLIDARPEHQYSLVTVVRQLCDETWGRVKTPEYRLHREFTEQFGEPSRAKSVRLPPHALSQRDMTVANAGGFLVGDQLRPYINALQPRSVALQLGVNTFDAGRGNVVLPKGTNATVTVWLADENAAMTESQPVFGAVSSTPKVLAALTEVTHQMLAQSNAEQILRTELQRAAGAALDAAVLSGTGTGGQPTGIANTGGIGSFTGTSLNRTGLTNAQLDVATGNAVLTASTGYVTTPAVAGALANRADTIESTKAVWQGNLHDGQMIGERALSTTGMPAASMLYGDWSNASVITWGTPTLAVDPFTKLSQGLVAIRLLFLADVVVTNVAGFTLSSSIT